MGATSVTGKGPGQSNKPTIGDLAALAQGPSIYLAGYVEGEEGLSSPPGTTNVVHFPTPLPGGSDKYVVLLTTQNAGYAYIDGMSEDDDGNFTGFSFIVETEGTVMYTVIKTGIRPSI